MKTARYSSLVLTGLLSACAPGAYFNPLADLRNSATYEAELYAKSVTRFLEDGGTEAQAMEKAKESIAKSLKDPGSAQFRDVSIKTFGANKIVCGEVNGKNSYGGYVGFKRFVAGVNVGTIQSTGSRYPDVDVAANAGLTAACGY